MNGWNTTFLLGFGLFSGSNDRLKHSHRSVRWFQSKDLKVIFDQPKLGGGSKHFWNVHPPKIGEDEPILTCAYFSKGLFGNVWEKEVVGSLIGPGPNGRVSE